MKWFSPITQTPRGDPVFQAKKAIAKTSPLLRQRARLSLPIPNGVARGARDRSRVFYTMPPDTRQSKTLPARTRPESWKTRQNAWQRNSTGSPAQCRVRPSWKRGMLHDSSPFAEELPRIKARIRACSKKTNKQCYFLLFFSSLKI